MEFKNIIQITVAHQQVWSVNEGEDGNGLPCKQSRKRQANVFKLCSDSF